MRSNKRWEAELALPVRRPRAKSRSAVIALRPEIDERLKSCSIPEQQKTDHGKLSDEPESAIASTRKLLIECRELRDNLRISRAQLQVELAELKVKLVKLATNAFGLRPKVQRARLSHYGFSWQANVSRPKHARLPRHCFTVSAAEQFLRLRSG